MPALLTGFALAFARGLGEYGSVVFISGNLTGKTEIAPMLVVKRLEAYDYPGAMALAVILFDGSMKTDVDDFRVGMKPAGLLATVGVLAVEHCACEDVSSACEHAGEACAQPDDCTDCLVPASPSALADEPVALLPSAHIWLGAPLLAPLFAHVDRPALATVRPIFSSICPACRPPALSAGAMCLRI